MLHEYLIVLNPKSLILFLEDDHDKFVRQKLLKINFGEMAEIFISVRQNKFGEMAEFFILYYLFSNIFIINSAKFLINLIFSKKKN